jgi:hypothetical protein
VAGPGKPVVNNDYTIQWDARVYQIARKSICIGLRGAVLRVEKRREGSLAVRFRDRCLTISQCDHRPKVTPAKNAPKRPHIQPGLLGVDTLSGL